MKRAYLTSLGSFADVSNVRAPFDGSLLSTHFAGRPKEVFLENVSSFSTSTAGGEGGFNLNSPTVWEFYQHSFPDDNRYGVSPYQITSTTFPITPQNLTIHPEVASVFPDEDADPLIVMTNGLYDNRINLRDEPIGTKFWTIIDTSGSTSATFIVTWFRPRYVPGMQIFRNGVLVLTTQNEGGSSTPALFDVTYTIP
jgi:hypothetical protein